MADVVLCRGVVAVVSAAVLPDKVIACT